MEDRCIVNTIKQRKLKWLGHVLRHDVLLRDILEGRMLGKRTRGRKRLQLMSNICCEGTSYKSVKKRAEDRCLWRLKSFRDGSQWLAIYSSTPEGLTMFHCQKLEGTNPLMVPALPGFKIVGGDWSPPVPMVVVPMEYDDDTIMLTL